jgi:hypothetical protein
MKNFFSLLLCCAVLGSAKAAPTVRVTVLVVTPDGIPIASANVGIGGGLSTPDGAISRHANGLTDSKGTFTAVIASVVGEVGAFARKEGYYETDSGKITLYSAGDNARKADTTGRWEPWDRTIKITLKPIKHPAPMYAKGIRGQLPERGKPLGYDLEKGDWVSPYGSGDHVDFEFTVTNNEVSPLNYSGALTVRVPGAGNGIQPFDRPKSSEISKLKMPYEAPLDGYLSSWTWRNGRATDDKPFATSKFEGEIDYGRGFFFRVRAVVDPDGKVISAWYGKINGPVIFDARGNGTVDIAYHLNPDTSRNVEFDPKRNLFTSLKQDERVGDP